MVEEIIDKYIPNINIKNNDISFILEELEREQKEMNIKLIEFKEKDIVEKDSNQNFPKILKKVFEDLTANFKEYIQICEITSRIRRQYRTSPKNPDFEKLFKRSKQSMKNNINQRETISNYFLTLTKDLESFLFKQNVYL